MDEEHLKLLLQLDILTPDEARKEFLDSMKWGQAGAVVPVDPTPEILAFGREDEETTNIIDGTGQIVYKITHTPNPTYDFTAITYHDKAREQQELYDNAVAALTDHSVEPLVFDPPEFDYQPPDKELKKSYQWYSTAPSIDERWHDETLVGTCSTCGMDDSPIVRTWEGKSDCKWCAELSNLNWHIKYNGGLGWAGVKSKWVMPDLLKVNWLRVCLILQIAMIFVVTALHIWSVEDTSPTVMAILLTIAGGLGVLDARNRRASGSAVHQSD